MIEQFFFSIAGKKPNQVINDLIEKFLSDDNVPSKEKNILKHTKLVAENGSYPTHSYYDTFYENSGLVYRSLAEITTYCKSVTDYYCKQAMERAAIAAINDSNSSEQLRDKLQSILEKSESDKSTEVEDIKPVTYGSLKDLKLGKGLNIGIKEIDEVTHGLQPGSVCAVCGFTGHGKTQTTDSIIFKNALEGKKCILFSLEMSPDLLWPQFEARYMYQVKGLSVTTQEFIHRTLPSDIETKVLEYEEDFKREIASNLVIVDESVFNKNIVLNYKSFSALVRKLGAKIGGVNLVAFDHVGQFELLYPDCGNQIIKAIQSFTKTFKDEHGDRPVSIIVVQANRQGEQRARKRNGVYDLQAIADLNEVERTSSYIIFIYTSEDMKIMQEAKFTLSKNRLGPVVSEPVVATFNPSVMTVGAVIENAIMSDEDFNNMDLDLGDGFDDF